MQNTTAREALADDPVLEGLNARLLSGAVYNILFTAGGGVLLLAQTVLVVRLLDPEDIGLFAVAAAASFMLEALSDFGIGDRLVQIDRRDLQPTFDLAVTVYTLIGIALWLIIVGMSPVLGRIYDDERVVYLTIGMSYMAFAGVLRLPLSLFYRNFQYLQHRALMFAGRAAGFVVTVAAAYAGAGVWSLVAGGAVALLVTCIPAWKLAAVVPRWRLVRSEVPALFAFSWPFWTAKVLIVCVDQASVFLLSAFLSFREVGYFRVGEQLAGIAVQLDVILGQTIFPALCRVRDSAARSRELFVVASRVAMIWGTAAGVVMTVFARELVAFVFTERWAGAELFIAANGVGVLLATVGYSWDLLYKARGDTVPLVQYVAWYAAAFFVMFPPLLWAYGALGGAIALVGVHMVALLLRRRIVSRLGYPISFVDIAKRSVAAAFVAAVAAVLFGRPYVGLPGFVLQVAVFGAVYLSIVLWFERSVLAAGVRTLRRSGVVGDDRLRLGIDAHILGKQKGGVETYVLSVVRTLARIDRSHDYFIYVTSTHPFRPGELPENFHLRLLPTGNVWIERALLIPYFYIVDRLDAIHVQRVLPFVGCRRSVVHIHDATYKTRPELFPRMYRELMNALIGWSGRRATAVATETEASKADIVYHYGLRPETVHVLPAGIDHTQFYPLSDRSVIDDARTRFGIAAPYVIYIGPIERNKNIETLVRAFAEAAPQVDRLVLVIVGRWRQETVKGYGAELARLPHTLGCADRVIFTGYVTNEDRLALINGAEMLVFPSFAEGFGLPPLEAMACGVPAIAATSAVAREVYGDAAILVEPYDVRGFAAAIVRVLSDPALAADMRRRGAARAAAYDCEAIVRRLLSLYEAVGAPASTLST